MPRIVIYGPEGRQEADLLPHNTIGRHPNNTVQVLDRIISKEHCHIDFENGRYVLKDLGSLNGSFVNNERISQRILNAGDEISLGSTRIVFDPDGAKAHSGPRTVPERPQGVGQALSPLSAPGSISGGPTGRAAPVLGTPPANPPASAQGTPGASSTGNTAGHAAWNVATGAAQLPPAPATPISATNSGRFPQAPAGAAASVGQASSPAPTNVAGAPAAATSPAKKLPLPPAKHGLLSSTKVTIATGMVESHIRTKLAPQMDQNFLPERLIQDPESLRRDYEKLRVSYELQRSIGLELDITRVMNKILEAAFQLLPADRGIILLFDEEGNLQPRAIRNRRGDEGGEVLISTTIVEQVLRERAAVLSSDAAVDSRFQGAHSIIMQGIRSSMAVPLLHSSEIFGIMLLDSQIATNAFTEKDLQLFQNVANQAAVSIQNSLFARRLEQEAVTRQKFQRLLSPAIAQQVIDGKVEIAKGGENRDTTVLFSDIRGFTSMSERARPETIVDMLNEYFELMVEVIFKHEGTLDKFVGDEIMALFGSPVAHPDDPYRAVRTAIEMSEVLAALNGTRQGRGEPPVHIGIGINSGEVVAGYLGSSKALEYTVIGDTVNTGARLCSLAQANQIIISQNTYDRVSNFVRVAELPPTPVKGKAAPLRIFNVLGLR